MARWLSLSASLLGFLLLTASPVPAHEGEKLLAQGQSAAALAEFEASQKIDPNRLAALYGAARAAESAGDAAKARRYYDRVAELGHKADADRPEVAVARAYFKK